MLLTISAFIEVAQSQMIHVSYLKAIDVWFLGECAQLDKLGCPVQTVQFSMVQCTTYMFQWVKLCSCTLISLLFVAGCLIFVAMSFLETVMVAVFIKKRRSSKTGIHVIHRVSRVAFPVAFMACVTGYLCFYLTVWALVYWEHTPKEKPHMISPQAAWYQVTIEIHQVFGLRQAVETARMTLLCVSIVVMVHLVSNCLIWQIMIRPLIILQNICNEEQQTTKYRWKVSQNLPLWWNCRCLTVRWNCFMDSFLRSSKLKI